jgi:hypothetical protein
LPLSLFSQETPDIIFTKNDSVFHLSFINCKGLILYGVQLEDSIPIQVKPELPALKNQVQKRPLITIHGNIMYDFNYRSYIDTPLALKDIQQHYVQSNFRMVFAEKYPLDIAVRTRQSNNRFFKNYTDINVQFNGTTFRDIAKQKLLSVVNNEYGNDQINRYKADFLYKSNALVTLGEWVKNDQRYNQYLEYKEFARVESKMQELLDTVTGKDSQMPDIALPFRKGFAFNQDDLPEIPGDDMNKLKLVEAEKFVSEYEEKALKYEKLKNEAEVAKTMFETKKSQVTNEVKEIKNKITAAENYEELKKIADTYGLKADSSRRPVRFLYNLQSIGFGRSFIDYSELTVKNVSINGFHSEYKSRYYFAVAVGTVDYRFRDFVFNPGRQKHQNIALVRAGKVLGKGRHLIFTAYRGQKNNFNFNDSISVQSKIYGFSAEASYQFNKNNSIKAEIAKSSFGATAVRDRSISKGSFDLSDNSTLAVFLNLHTVVQKTKTKVRATYRYQGGNFQSYTLYYMQNNLASWSLLADQPFWKNRILIQAGVRKNEFTSPYAAFNYKANTIFKSIQASIRIKKFPFVTMAYMPSSQLSIVDNQITENRFYTLMASATHFYHIGNSYTSTLVMYSRYYNDKVDTSFIYYNARNFHLAQSVMGKYLTFNSSFSISKGIDNNLYTYESGLTYSKKSFSIGVGGKYNDLKYSVSKMGYYGSGSYEFKRLHLDLSFSFEHGFLPGMYQTLVNNDFGRVTLLKRF